MKTRDAYLKEINEIQTSAVVDRYVSQNLRRINQLDPEDRTRVMRAAFNRKMDLITRDRKER